MTRSNKRYNDGNFDIFGYFLTSSEKLYLLSISNTNLAAILEQFNWHIANFAETLSFYQPLAARSYRGLNGGDGGGGDN